MALALSLVFFRFGQVYNDDQKKGAVMLIGGIVGAVISGGLLAIPLWIWSMIDAYQVANGRGKTRPPGRIVQSRPTALAMYVVMLALVVAVVWLLFARVKGTDPPLSAVPKGALRATEPEDQQPRTPR